MRAISSGRVCGGIAEAIVRIPPIRITQRRFVNVCQPVVLSTVPSARVTWYQVMNSASTTISAPMALSARPTLGLSSGMKVSEGSVSDQRRNTSR